MPAPSKSSVLAVLKQAQVIDKKIFDLTERAEEIPVRIKNLEQVFHAEKVTLDGLAQQLKAFQAKQKELENDLSGHEEKIRKYDGQLAQVKTNKEYSALQQEILGVKADVSLVEEKIIVLLDEIDAAQTKVNLEKDRLKQEESKLGNEKKILDGEKGEALKEIEKLTAERKSILSEVETEVKVQYENILKKRQGLALSPLVGENCGVCQMLTRPQIQNEVKSGDRIVTCESCGRILYVE